MSDTLHIVCLDAPSPPDYGGAIDMFYKIKALAEIGKKVILHYFAYQSHRNAGELEAYCSAVYAYERKSFIRSVSLSSPFIVESRINKQLVGRLNKDRYPILLEGLHCAGLIPLIEKNERVILRMHNEEVAYYKHLAATEKDLPKKLYYKTESLLIDRFQRNLDKSILLACLSETDLDVFKNKFGFRNLFFLPCFLPWQGVTSLTGTGDYCLYHGNLSVAENKEAAHWLIRNVFSQVAVPLVVTGSGIPPSLYRLAKKHANIRLINNPPIDEINALVRDAHIHVLPSMNRTGVKLKLLNALLNGRFCITNEAGVRGSKIEESVVVAEDAVQWQEAVTRLMQESFTQEDKEKRAVVLALYNNKENARLLSEQWTHYR